MIRLTTTRGGPDADSFGLAYKQRELLPTRVLKATDAMTSQIATGEMVRLHLKFTMLRSMAMTLPMAKPSADCTYAKAYRENTATLLLLTSGKLLKPPSTLLKKTEPMPI